jgi:glycosyltransferase involved in cell wall biosynthesis
MRVLLYNFVQPEEPGAGGVGVYLNNLAKALAKDHEVILLSSGDRYSPRQREPRVEFSQDHYHRAIIINSPVLAPAAYSFGDPDTYLTSKDLDFVPGLLADRYGQIDAFHFQNIEGLNASFFRVLRKVFPKAQILYSAHNYHPVCPRFTLWYQDRTLCTDYREGAACTMCLAPVFDSNYIRAQRRLMWLEKAHPRAMAVFSPALAVAKRGRRLLLKRRWKGGVAEAPVSAALSSNQSGASPASYAAFRKSNIALFEDVFDRVLAVSKRTGQVIIDRGVPAHKVSVSYIGTAHKSTYLASTKIRDIGSGLHLGYIGYMGTDKGFNFLLECLEKIPADVAAEVTVTIAAKNTFPERRARMENLAPRFKALRYFDGYTHSNLDTVLSGVNLGLIPVLWEDNLPQTAIELVSRGIPILTSDRGGAQEIAHNPKFIFQSGEHDDFVDRVCRISRRELELDEFWGRDMNVFSMDEHVEDLMHHYRKDDRWTADPYQAGGEMAAVAGASGLAG